MDTAVLGGGCFWCLEAVFARLRGVSEVLSGYSGGSINSPSYEAVCSGTTGHAEVVRVTFDPAVISYRDLLEVFFGMHDPTTLNRQGHDVGTQYRSVIYYQSNAQREVAQVLIDELNGSAELAGAVVTELAPSQDFFPAEDYHQRYYEGHTAQPYCALTIAPKLAKLRGKYLSLLI